MLNTVFHVGDVVMLVSGGTTLYKIVMLYEHGNSICNYVDQETSKVKEISIPVVALAKCKSERTCRYGSHYNQQFERQCLPYTPQC